MPPQGVRERRTTTAAPAASTRTGHARLQVVPSPEPVALVGLPPTAWPQVAESGLLDPLNGASVLATPGELTLLVPWGSAPVARGLFPGIVVDGPYRMLTVDASLEDACVTRVLDALARAGISARALTSVRRDHVLVPEHDADRAMDTLRGVPAASAT